jgi:hypothetical protein
MAKAAPKKRDEKTELVAKISKALGIPASEVELRALRELAERLPKKEPTRPPPAAPATHGGLPQRLFLLLDGRGLDGRGMPTEVIDLPCIAGSEKHCTIWINSPQIETRHLQITRSDEGWVLEDLNTEHGTFLGDKRIKRRVIQNGDEYRLAGYLRFRTELR